MYIEPVHILYIHTAVIHVNIYPIHTIHIQYIYYTRIYDYVILLSVKNLGKYHPTTHSHPPNSARVSFGDLTFLVNYTSPLPQTTTLCPLTSQPHQPLLPKPRRQSTIIKSSVNKGLDHLTPVSYTHQPLRRIRRRWKMDAYRVTPNGCVFRLFFLLCFGISFFVRIFSSFPIFLLYSLVYGLSRGNLHTEGRVVNLFQHALRPWNSPVANWPLHPVRVIE